MHLGMVFEGAGRIDDAIAEYENALEIDRDHLPGVTALAMARLRHGRTDESTAGHLRTIILRTQDANLAAWAREELIRLESTEQRRGQ